MPAFPGHKVINAGVNGWGTGQALLAVEALLGQHDDVELVVYGFIANHLHRNHRRRSWLEGIDREAPFFLWLVLRMRRDAS